MQYIMVNIFKWFSEGFNKFLNKHKIFENLINEKFGHTQVLFYPLRSNNAFDIRETLEVTELEKEFLNNILWNRIITNQDNNDEKVLKITEFVNKHLNYKSDKNSV